MQHKVMTTVYIHWVKETIIFNRSILIPVPIKLKLFKTIAQRSGLQNEVHAPHAVWKTIHSGQEESIFCTIKKQNFK